MSTTPSRSPVLSEVEGKGEVLIWRGPAGYNPDLGDVAAGREFRVGRDITGKKAESFKLRGLLQDAKEMGSRKDAKGAQGEKEMQSRKDAKSAKDQNRED